MPLFSIIAPVYNVEKYLDRCINSVLSQTYSDFELILVDDGSKDTSGRICDEYAIRDSRIRVFHKQNGGVSSARNLGLERAHGERVIFIDSDDYLELNALEVICNYLKENDTDLLVYGIQIISSGGVTQSFPYNLSFLYCGDKEAVRKELLPYACYSSSFVNSPCNKVYRASLIRETGLYFANRVRGEDWLFNVHYLQVISTAISIDMSLYNYVTHSDSAMTKYVPEQFVLWEENWNVKKELIKNYGLSVDSKIMRREMLVKIYYFVKEIAKQEDTEKANKKLHYISRSRLLKGSMSVIPNSLQGVKAFVYMLYMRIINSN